MGGDGRPLVSWLGRIRAVWDRSDLTQPSFSRTGHVRLDLSHTTDIIPLSGETTAHHHSTADGGERAGGGDTRFQRKRRDDKGGESDYSTQRGVGGSREAGRSRKGPGEGIKRRLNIKTHPTTAKRKC